MTTASTAGTSGGSGVMSCIDEEFSDETFGEQSLLLRVK
jgi:hypothetical protein